MDIFAQGFHLTTGGYHIRHDLLMSLDLVQRQTLMTYFIGTQTPWKMNPDDRDTYENVRNG